MISPLFMIIFVINLIAFALSVPLNGFLSSLLITHGAYDKMYAHDEDADNLFGYFDMIGLLCFIFLGFGWGTILPVNPAYISGRFRIARTALAYSAQSLVSFFLALCAIIASLLLTSKECMHKVMPYMFSMHSLDTITSDSAQHLFQQSLSQFAHCSSYAITATLFFVGVIFIQAYILCISMVMGVLEAGTYTLRYRIGMHHYSSIFMLIIRLIFCLLFYHFFFAVTLTCILASIDLFSLLLKGV